MADITYPFDPTGALASNKIRNEQHTTTESNFRDYRFIIPDFSPFFAEGLVVKYKDSDGNVRTLTPGFDYYEAMIYLDATRAIGKPIYGGITINNPDINGVISIEYQTIGGGWIADKQYVYERLTELVYNPRTTVWDIITDKYDQFPPVNHLFEVDKIWGQEKLIEAITAMASAILRDDSSNQYVKHFFNFNNPHKTSKGQVGLGLVENFTIGAPEDVTAHNRNDLYVTPYMLTPIFTLIDQINKNHQALVKALADHTALTTEAHGLAQIVASINQNINGVQQELDLFENETSNNFQSVNTKIKQTADTAANNLQQAVTNINRRFDTDEAVVYENTTLTLKGLTE